MVKKCILIFLLSILLCGCTTTDSTEAYVYTVQPVTYSEENGQSSFQMDMDSVDTERAHYFFEPVIEDTQRQSCIEATEQILDAVDAKAPTPSIYIFSAKTYPGIYISENSAYLCQQNWHSADYAARILLAVYGEYTHYGMAYGYADVLCKRFQWIDSEEILFSLPDNPEICDLNLLCFDDNFSSEHDVTAARKIACDFVNYFTSSYGETAFRQMLAESDTSSGMNFLVTELGKYYTNVGLSIQPSVVRYGYGGRSFDYIVKSDLATFYIGTKWVDENRGVNPLVGDNFLHENYAEVKAFFETNLTQMSQYQELFALDDYNNDLNIVFSNNKSLSQYTFYQSGIHRIYVMNIDSLMHEYIHALTQPDSSMDLWEVEGFARYFSYKYDCYGISFLNQDYNNTPETPETQYVHEFLEEIKRPIDMATDFKELENIAVYSRGYEDPNASYVSGSSFIQYLVYQYGEEPVIQYIYGNGNSLPKSISELIYDWNIYISETYQNYSKYES